jgi:hypothetical protein
LPFYLVFGLTIVLSLSISPHFSQVQLICEGYWPVRRKATKTVAPKALAVVWFFVSPVGLGDDAAD